MKLQMKEMLKRKGKDLAHQHNGIIIHKHTILPNKLLWIYFY